MVDDAITGHNPAHITRGRLDAASAVLCSRGNPKDQKGNTAAWLVIYTMEKVRKDARLR